MEVSLGTVCHGDCVEGLQSLPAGDVDLVFADPPFNIGYDYDVYDDKQERDQYLDWCRSWIAAFTERSSHRERFGWPSATNMPPS